MYFCNTHSLSCAVWHCTSWLRCCLGISPQVSDFRHMPPRLPIVHGYTAHTRIYCQSTVSLQEAKVPPASSSKANVHHNLTWLVQKITRASFVFPTRLRWWTPLAAEGRVTRRCSKASLHPRGRPPTGGLFYFDYSGLRKIQVKFPVFPQAAWQNESSMLTSWRNNGNRQLICPFEIWPNLYHKVRLLIDPSPLLMNLI
jgi:hypothetical protein